ncbi:alpha-N-acetylgalactosaminide alpha-2,6-sialyltransferase 1 isoform X1 [Maylandia zebra]|uniref:alpha-N-acetylgalactosaminide alpha-2,6-sialyltransferase 1 isoform X1 n=1 Tax=Maylandia zebra TaxID=106582 RepID=UPI00403C6463
MAELILKFFSLLFLSSCILIILNLLDNRIKSISWSTFIEIDDSESEDFVLERYRVYWERKLKSGPPHPDFEAEIAEIADSAKNNTIQCIVAETPMALLYKKDFKKLPRWDFEDVYSKDTQHRRPTCAQSLRNSQDEKFKKAFLPNIRLFLHKDNINMSEWNRLSHFNSPFGFMNYKYDDVMDSVKLIPKPNKPLLLPKPGGDGCVRCAVVGTGGILNGSKKGVEIDGHDYVFRMNGAITKGYEEDVGNKTSVYVHTAHSITTSLYLLKKYGYKSAPHDEGIKYVLIPEGMRDFQWLKALLRGEKVSAGPYRNKLPRTYYSGQYNESRFYVLHQDFLRYVRNRFLLSPNLNKTFWSLVRPTNGAFTVFLALHTCDIVDAYGFMTDDYVKYPNYYVEKNMSKVIFYANHDYILEKNTWKDLHNRKIIRLFRRTESKAKN